MTMVGKPVDCGVLAAVLTPIGKDLAPEFTLWIDHCRWLLDQGCDGLAVLGTTSEANSFSVKERLTMLDALAESNIPGNALIPGTGCCALTDTVALTQKAMDIGAAGVLMLPPFYYKPVTDKGLFDAYSAVIDRVADDRLRIYLYHIPQNTGVPITFGLIEKLRTAYPETVVGIKDSAGDFANMEGMIKNFPEFRVFSGSDTFLLQILRAGGAGAITACNNICAALSARVFANWQNDDAEALQQAVHDVRSIIQKFPLVAALKEIVAQTTGEAGWRRQRPPLEPLLKQDAATLVEQLGAVGFTLARAA